MKIVKNAAANEFKRHGQLGVGVANGAEAVTHMTRDYLQWCKANPDYVLLKLDCENAFNLISRTKVLEALMDKYPILFPFADMVLSRQNPLYFHNFDVMYCSVGTQQGCPTSPMAYAAGMEAVIGPVIADFFKNLTTKLKLRVFLS